MADARLSVANGARVALRAHDSPSAALSVGREVYVGGTKDYEALENKPSIEGVELLGDRKLSEFGVSKASNLDIINLFK